jgi:hypothetical protein
MQKKKKMVASLLSARYDAPYKFHPWGRPQHEREMQAHPIPCRVIQARARLLVVLVFALGWGPAPAQAGCGKHILLDGEAIHLNRDRPAQPMPAPLPCQGPHCSSNDSLPLVPPGSVSRLASSNDLYPIFVARIAAPPRSLDRTGSETPDMLSHRTSDIFHPPR